MGIMYLRYLLDIFPKLILKIELQIDVEGFWDLRVILRSKESFLLWCKFLKKHQLMVYNTLIDVFGIDYPMNIHRFCLVYQYSSLLLNHRIFTSVVLKEFEAMPSLQCLFEGANWVEREIWDMFGVFFSNNQDLRKILTDYGFQGFPLRKDFPLTGFSEVFYDDEQKTVITCGVQISQEYRLQEGLSPWEQIKEYDYSN